MSARFEEIDWRSTPMGEISLRRRREPVTGTDVYEVKLGDEFLMSSMFTAGEVALARLALAQLPNVVLDVVVGGLGLGHTADAVLADPRLGSLVVIEALPEVIEWHEQGKVPLGDRLATDPRCRLAHADFFALSAGDDSWDPEQPGRRFHAVVVDIDHSPDHLLHPSHASLYKPEGLHAVARKLHPGGVFALWSNEPPSDAFTATLAGVFAESRAHVVSFDNPLSAQRAANTVYVARSGQDSA